MGSRRLSLNHRSRSGHLPALTSPHHIPPSIVNSADVWESGLSPSDIKNIRRARSGTVGDTPVVRQQTSSSSRVPLAKVFPTPLTTVGNPQEVEPKDDGDDKPRHLSPREAGSDTRAEEVDDLGSSSVKKIINRFEAVSAMSNASNLSLPRMGSPPEVNDEVRKVDSALAKRSKGLTRTKGSERNSAAVNIDDILKELED